MAISPARAKAFDILLRVEQEGAYAAELLHSSSCVDLSPADQGLLTELVMGVLRWRSVLDARIAEVSSLSRLDLEVLLALRLGTYQLGWLDRVPAHAAVHESVELVKRARKRSAMGFVNAILRRIARLPGERNQNQIESATDPDQIAAGLAHPAWMVQRWASQFGVETTRKICEYNQSIPVTSIRLRTGAAEQELLAAGIQLAKGQFLPDSRRVVSGDVTRTGTFAEGHVAIQDEASQLVAVLVGKGRRILDCCAAPGGKTWAIADRNPDAAIVALELHPHRAELLRKRVTAKNVQVITGDARQFPVGAPFDRVLVDAPCSGTGTIARNPEIKWRLTQEDLGDLHARQIAIVQAAMRHVAPGGQLIYSTCSLEREEDEDVITQAMDGNSSFRVVEMSAHLERLRRDGELLDTELRPMLRGPYLQTIPGLQACDGFFVSVLERLP